MLATVTENQTPMNTTNKLPKERDLAAKAMIIGTQAEMGMGPMNLIIGSIQ